MAVFELKGISKQFGATTALDSVNLSVGAGEVHALIGENGAGKSTLLNILAGEIRADQGEMEINREKYLPLSPNDARSAGIAMIHQELSLFPHLSVAENIFAGMEPASFGIVNRK